MNNARRTWQEIAEDLCKESDPERIVKLAAELNAALLEEDRKRLQPVSAENQRRIGI